MEQLMTSSDCKKCSLCCRFADGFEDYAPVFSTEEKEKVLKKGFPSSLFKKIGNELWQVSLERRADQVLYCPFYSGWQCKIYDVEPFECVLWPFYVMKSRDGKKALLAIDEDEACPAALAESKKFKSHVVYLIKKLQSEEMVRFFSKNPQLIYRYEADYKVLSELPGLSGLLVIR
ncbi:YkgJ family cysteine cluster protein [Candidatus Woesearchaeota archaeon]|nr:YkgJ family cysteine cluster protein [Candidatus Woesearchaeota archaeon]